MQKSSFNKLSILLFIIVILSSCNKDNGIEEISESYIEIKVLRISKDNTKTPIYNAIAYIYYDIAPIDLANYTDKGNGIYSNGKNTIIPNQVKRTNIDGDIHTYGFLPPSYRGPYNGSYMISPLSYGRKRRKYLHGCISETIGNHRLGSISHDTQN